MKQVDFTPIKVLIVDDSAFFRRIISEVVSSDERFAVAGTARNGREALDKIQELEPDIVTMDVNMPVMDGLEALHQVMSTHPLPVLILSSVAVEGAYVTIRALEEGAVDFMLKPSSWVNVGQEWRNELIQKLLVANRARLVLRRSVQGGADNDSSGVKQIFHSAVPTRGRIVVIGSSTGGPGALKEVITKLPADFPCGVLIVQHMPPLFTKTLAERLNMASAIEVKEAEAGDLVRPGMVYIAPGDYHMTVNKTGSIILNQDPPIGTLRPAVDVLFQSAAVSYGPAVVAAVLTGMGSDGKRGAKSIKAAGGRVLAQSEQSCVVYGMPRAVVDAGLADAVVPLGEMADELVRTCR